MQIVFFNLFLLLFSSSIAFTQEEKVFQKVEMEANTDARLWMEHIKKNSKLSDSVSVNIPAGTYKINVQFIIDIHGNIGQVKSKNNPGYSLDARAENIIKNYKGIWKPASQCGRLVKSYREQPVIFIIAD
jgi:hypothetical protein